VIASGSVEAGPPRSAAALVGFMWGAYFLNYCDRQVVFSLFPVLKNELGFTDTQLGLTGSLFLWVYAIGCPVAGLIGDRMSKRVLVTLSLLIWSLVTFLTGLAGSALVLLACRVAMGVSESLYMPSAISLTAGAHAPSQRSRAIAVLTTAQIAGTVGGGWFGGWMGEIGHWRSAFFVLGIVGIIYALPYFEFLKTLPEPIVKSPQKRSLPWLELARIPSYLFLCLAFPVFVFGLWLLYGWLPTFLHEKFSLGLSKAAFNATVFLQGANLVGLLAGGILADRVVQKQKAARFWILAASLVLTAPCLYAIAKSDSLSATRFAAIGFGLSAGFFMGNIFPASFDVVPAHARASAVGCLNFFGAAMSGFATLFGGVWKKSLGIDYLIILSSAGYIIMAAALIIGTQLFFRRDHSKVI
jgi:predicted MFS family arabinose efflux permease